MVTFPIYWRVKPATIRHLSPRQEDPLPIKLLTLFSRNHTIIYFKLKKEKS